MPDVRLEVRDLCYSYSGADNAADHVSFHVDKGSFVGLIGPNGSGKSTTVNLISGIYAPDSGDVIYQGESLLRYSIPQRSHKGIGRTFQTPKPFLGLSVFDSVYTIALQFGTYRQAAERTNEILKMTELDELAPLKCDKLPIEKRKWLDMARILATSPKVIMLDEVMAGLNPSEIDESIGLIKRINEQGVSIIFIEHVMRAVTSLSHRIVVLDEGKFLCEGTPEAVMNDPRVIEAYLGGGHKRAEH